LVKERIKVPSHGEKKCDESRFILAQEMQSCKVERKLSRKRLVAGVGLPARKRGTKAVAVL